MTELDLIAVAVLPALIAKYQNPTEKADYIAEQAYVIAWALEKLRRRFEEAKLKVVE